MLMVCAEQARVETDLWGGRLACPCCAGELGPWGRATARPVRGLGGGLRWLRPRRAICRACRVTHVLLPDLCLLRRRDEVAVIGAALLAKVAGEGHRVIARRLGVVEDTVRGWLRRFGRDAEQIRAHFVRWAFALDPELGPLAPAGTAFADAMTAIGVACRAFVLRFGPQQAWPLVARLSGGALLCQRTTAFAWVP